MKFRNNKNGSVTVEAALCLPIFMAFMLLISSIARVYYTHELVQDALSDASNEIASTAYIFSITGLKGTRDDIHSSVEDKGKVAYEDFGKLLDCIDIAKSGANSLKEGNLEGVLDASSNGQKSGIEIKSSAENIAENPVEYLRSMASVGVAFGMEKGEDAIMSLMIKQLMYKHLKVGDISANQRLEKLHVTNGIKGLSFKESVYFNNSEDMDVVVTYTLERVDPFGLVRNVTLTNHVKTRVWVNGEGDVVGRSDESEKADEFEEADENKSEEYNGTKKTGENTSSEEEEKEKPIEKEMYLYSDGKNTNIFHNQINCRNLTEYKLPKLVEGIYIESDGNGKDFFKYNEKIYELCNNCSTGRFKGGEND